MRLSFGLWSLTRCYLAHCKYLINIGWLTKTPERVAFIYSARTSGFASLQQRELQLCIISSYRLGALVKERVFFIHPLLCFFLYKPPTDTKKIRINVFHRILSEWSQIYFIPCSMSLHMFSSLAFQKLWGNFTQLGSTQSINCYWISPSLYTLLRFLLQKTFITQQVHHLFSYTYAFPRVSAPFHLKKH